MALASFSPFYKSPAEIIRMRDDLSALPVWFAAKDAFVWVASPQYCIDFKNQCSFPGLNFKGGCLGGRCGDEQVVFSLSLCGNGPVVPEKKNILFQPPFVGDAVSASEPLIMPWGWDPALVNYWLKNGVCETYLPDTNQLSSIRSLSGRQQCVKVLAGFKGWNLVCGEASVCTTLDEVKNFLSIHTDVILKAPWSGSGRGLTRTSLGTWNANLEGWVRRIFRTQGFVMAEPIYNKVLDFAMEFHVNSLHQLSFVGYSLFETDSHGNYKGNVLMSNKRIISKLTPYVSAGLIERVKAQLLSSLSSLLGTEYTGYFGVDMMVCEVDGLYCIHPCVEINLRMNMGLVARFLYDDYMSNHTEGHFVVEHYTKDGEALEHDCRMRDLFPAIVESGRMHEGYFPLTPVTSATRYQCYVICHPIHL